MPLHARGCSPIDICSRAFMRCAHARPRRQSLTSRVFYSATSGSGPQTLQFLRRFRARDVHHLTFQLAKSIIILIYTVPSWFSSFRRALSIHGFNLLRNEDGNHFPKPLKNRETMSSTEKALHPCSTKGCEKKGSLRCPTCKELGVDSVFCSQECFKGSWNEHKMIHKTIKELMSQVVSSASTRAVKVPKSFEGYSFTGKIRPGEVTARMSVPKGIPKPDYAESGLPKSEMALRGSNVIPVFKGEEIEHLRKAGRCVGVLLIVLAAGVWA